MFSQGTRGEWIQWERHRPWAQAGGATLIIWGQGLGLCSPFTFLSLTSYTGEQTCPFLPLIPERWGSRGSSLLPFYPKSAPSQLKRKHLHPGEQKEAPKYLPALFRLLSDGISSGPHLVSQTRWSISFVPVTLIDWHLSYYYYAGHRREEGWREWNPCPQGAPSLVQRLYWCKQPSIKGSIKGQGRDASHVQGGLLRKCCLLWSKYDGRRNKDSFMKKRSFEPKCRDSNTQK